MTTQITLEGFVDLSGDFDMGVYICKPIVASYDALSVDEVIENYCIDFHLKTPIEDEDNLDTKRRILNVFYKTRKRHKDGKGDTETYSYWKAVVEIEDSKTDEYIYSIVDVEGTYLE